MNVPAIYETRRPIFDADDLDYLVGHLSEGQLKSELLNHDVQRAHEVLERWPECFEDHDFYLVDFGEAVKLALHIVQAHKPNPKPIKGQIDVAGLKARVDIVAVAERYTCLRKAGRNL